MAEKTLEEDYLDAFREDPLEEEVPLPEEPLDDPVAEEDYLDAFRDDSPPPVDFEEDDPLAAFREGWSASGDPALTGTVSFADPDAGPTIVPAWLRTPAGSVPKGRSIWTSKEKYAQQKVEEEARRRALQEQAEAEAALGTYDISQLRELLPGVLPDMTDEVLMEWGLPVDERKQARKDWARVQAIGNTKDIPQDRVLKELVAYTTKYHPTFKSFVGERLEGALSRAEEGVQEFDDPTKLAGGYGKSLMGAMWWVDKPARRWRAAYKTQFEHTMARINDPENEPAVLNPAEWKRRLDKNYELMVWTPERGNELAKMRYILNRLPGVGGTGFGLGLGGDLVDVMTDPHRDLLLRGGENDLGQLFSKERRELSRQAREAKGDPEKMKEFVKTLEKEFDERHQGAAESWTRAGYKIGEIFSHIKGGSTPEDWQRAAEEAVEKGSVGGKEFLGEVQTGIIDPLNFVSTGPLKGIVKGGVQLTGKAGKAVEQAINALSDSFMKASSLAPGVSDRKARSIARSAANEIVVDQVKEAADTAYRSGRHEIWGTEQALDIRKFTAPDEAMSGAIDRYIVDHGLPIKPDAPTVTKGEAVWSHLQKEAGRRKELYRFTPGPIEGTDAAGRVARSVEVEWYKPEGAWRDQRFINVFDAAKARFGRWMMGKVDPSWDIYRRRASSILNPNKAQPYVTGKGTDARLIPEKDIAHPARFKDAEFRDMQNLRRRATDAARMAKFIKELTTHSDNPEVQYLGAMLGELGRHMPMTEETLLVLAKLQNVEDTLAKAAAGDLSDLPQGLMDDLSGAQQFEEFGKQLSALSIELEKTRGLSDDAVVLGADGKQLPAKEARKQLLRTATANIKLIREMISDSLVDSFRRERQLRVLEETAPTVDKIAALKEARENLQKAISEKVWHGSEDFDTALSNLKQFKGNWTKSLDEIVRPTGPAPDFAKNEAATVKRLQDEGLLPPGEMKDWTAEKTRINREITDVFREVEKKLPPIEKLKGKAKKILGLRDNQVEPFKLLLGARAKAWAFLNGLPERYADAWYAKQELSFRYADDPKSIDNKGRPVDSKGRRSFDLEEALSSPEFKQWFRKSKVVGEDGKPLVVTHGTLREFDAFDPRSVGQNTLRQDTNQGAAFFFTDNRATAGQVAVHMHERMAARAGMPPGTADESVRYIDSYLSLQNPLVWVESGDTVIDTGKMAELIRKAKSEGHDGVIYKNEKHGSTYVAFEPTQIKSVDNIGTWSPDDPRFLFEGGADSAPGERFKELYNSATKAHPIDERYRLWDGGQTAVFDKFDEAPEISDIHLEMMKVNFDKKGTGAGNKILSEIVRMADEAGARISLEPVAKGGPMSDTQLASWYKRNGFEASEEFGEEVLVRNPVTQIKSTQNVGTWSESDSRLLRDTGDEAPRQPYNPEQGPRFYSVLERVIEGAPGNLKTIGDYQKWLSGKGAQTQGLKQEELIDALVPMMEGEKAVSKQELIELIRSNRRPWSVRVESAPDLGTLEDLPTEAYDLLKKQQGFSDPYMQTYKVNVGDLVRVRETSSASGFYDIPGPDADFSQGLGFSRSGIVHPQAGELDLFGNYRRLLSLLQDDDFILELVEKGFVAPQDEASDLFNVIRRSKVETEDMARFHGRPAGRQIPPGERDYLVERVTVDHTFLDKSGATETSVYVDIPGTDGYEIQLPNLFSDSDFNNVPRVFGQLRPMLSDMGLPSREASVEVWGRHPQGRVVKTDINLTPDMSEADKAGFDQLVDLAKNKSDMTVRGNAPDDHFAHTYDVGHQSIKRGGPKGPKGTDYTEMTFSLDELNPGETPLKETMGPEYHYGESFVDKAKYDPNIFLHVRFDTVDHGDGVKLLRILEIQSDLHGQARDRGYGPGLKEGRTRIPDAPYKRSWHKLAVKSIVDHAVKNGFDEIIWEGGFPRRGRMDRTPASVMYDEKIRKEISKALKVTPTAIEPSINKIRAKGLLRVKTPEKLHKKLGYQMEPEGLDLPSPSGDFADSIVNVIANQQGRGSIRRAIFNQVRQKAPSSTDDLAKDVGEVWAFVTKDAEKSIELNMGELAPKALKRVMNGRRDLIKALAANDHRAMRNAHRELKAGLKKIKDAEGKRGGALMSEAYDIIEKHALDFDAFATSAARASKHSVSKIDSKFLPEDLRAFKEIIDKNDAWTGIDFFIPPSSKYSYANKVLSNSRKMAEGKSPFPSEWRATISDDVAADIRRDGQPLYARDGNYVRGQIEFFGDGKKIITIFEKGDFSTLVHETGHLFRRDLPAEEQARADAWVKKQLGKKAFRKDGSWSTLSEEIFAQAFVKYMKTGEFPEAISRNGLQGVFIKYKMWMREVYVAIAGQSGRAYQAGTDGKYHPRIEEMLSRSDSRVAAYISSGKKTFTEAEVAKMSRDRKAKLIAEKSGGFFEMSPDIKSVFDRLFDPRAIDESPLTNELRLSRREYELSGPLDQIFSAAKYRNSIQRIMGAAGFPEDEIKKTVRRALSKESTSIAVATQTLEEASNRLAGSYHAPKPIRGFKAPRKTAFSGAGNASAKNLKRLLVKDIITNTMLSEAEAKMLVDEVLPKFSNKKVSDFLAKTPRERNSQWRAWIEEVASKYVARHPDDLVNELPTMKRPRSSDTSRLGAQLGELWDKARKAKAKPADALAFRRVAEKVVDEVDIPLEHRGKTIRELISANEWTTVKAWVDEARKLLDDAVDEASPADDVLEKANEIASKKRKVSTKQVKQANKMVDWIDGAVNDLEDIVRREIILARKEAREFSNAAAQASTDEIAMGAEESVAEMLSAVGRSTTGIEPRATVKLPRKGVIERQAGSTAKRIKELEKKIKTTGAGAKLDNLKRALDELKSKATDVDMEISPQRSADRLNRLLEKFPEFSKELMSTAKLLNYDLRTPGEVWREILNLRHEARAYGDFAQLQRDVAMDAFRKAEYADILRDMSNDQVNKVIRILKDPNRRLYGVGRNATPEAKRIAKKLGLVGTEDLLIGLKKGARADKAGRFKVGDTFSPEEIEEALKVAELIDGFMDEQLQKMQSAGRLKDTVNPAVVDELKTLGKRLVRETDKAKQETIQKRIDYLRENELVVPWTKEEFLQRVNLASYIPHILSSVTSRKISVLRGRGLLPKEQKSGFEKFRKRASFLDEINEVARDDLATEMLYHMATTKVGPAWKADGPFAKFTDPEDLESLSSVLRSNDLESLFSKEEWGEAIKWARGVADLDELYDFFEADVPTLLKYYTRSVDRVVSDAMYIRDMQEMFPLGKELSELIQSGSAGWDAARASEYGYSKLSVEDTIMATTRQGFPPELRKHSEYIQARLAEGDSPGEIVSYLRGLGVSVDTNVINAYKLKPVYLPTPVVEYMRWMNTPDPGSGPIVQIYDGYLGVMKAQTTIASLAHVGMNFAGNYLSIWQKLGVRAFNPVNHYYAFLLSIDDTSSLWRKNKSKEINFGGEIDTLENWRNRIEMETAISEAPASAGIQEEMFGSIREARAPLAASLPLAGAGAATGFALGTVAGPLGQAAGITMGTWLGALVAEVLSAGYKKGRSPFEVVKKGLSKVRENEVRDFMDKASKGGTGNKKDAILYWGERSVGLTASAAINSVFLGPLFPIVTAIGGVSFPSYMRMMADLNSGIELQGRLTLGIGELRRGASMREASDSVDDAMRNYSHLTPFERHTMRRFFFFYTWDAGNVRFQLGQALNNPRSYAVLKNFLNAVQNGSFSEGDISSMPPEMRYDIILRTDYAKMFNIHGVPAQAAIEFLARTDHGIPLGGLSRMAPVPSVALEYLNGAGQSLFYGKKWEEVNNVRAWKDSTPLIRQFAGVPMKDGKVIPTSFAKVYNKHGEWTGKKRAVYKSTRPREFYLLQKVLPFRVIREHNKLVQSTFMPRSVDGGDLSALATSEERMAAYLSGIKPMAFDPEGSISLYNHLLLLRLEEIYKTQGVPISYEIRRLREELSARGMLATEPLSGAERDENAAQFPLYRAKKE